MHRWDTRVSRSAIRDRGSSSWRELAITSPFFANPWAARFTYIDFLSIIRGKRAKRQKGKRAKRQKGKKANQLISGEWCPVMGAVVRAHCGVLGAGCQVEDFAVGVTVE